jgi:hypothetical protein
MRRMRPIDFCKPTDLPSTCGSFDSSTFIEGDKVDALLLASAFAIALRDPFHCTAMFPCPLEQNGNRVGRRS